MTEEKINEEQIDCDLVERLRKAWAKPMGKPVKLPPLITLGPGQSIAVFLKKRPNQTPGAAEETDH